MTAKTRAAEWRRAYRRRPEVKQKLREYRRRPEVKAKRREYRNRPEIKARSVAWRREYFKRPEVRERLKEWRKTRNHQTYAREYQRRNYRHLELLRKKRAREKLFEMALGLGFTPETVKAYILDGKLLKKREKDLEMM